MWERRTNLKSAALACAVAASLFACGCGAKSPQPPAKDMTVIQDTLNALGEHCGEASEIQAFHEDVSQLTRLDTAAQVAARTLARENRTWVYQGDSIGHVIRTWASNLAGCGLRGAALELSRATRRG